MKHKSFIFHILTIAILFALKGVSLAAKEAPNKCVDGVPNRKCERIISVPSMEVLYWYCYSEVTTNCDASVGNP